jgi:aerobic-type carbon monoxide dehydrogenase small subunit (CoxS/CutS family)
MPAQAIAFRVNGRVASATVDADTMLLYVLRNDLRLKGTRFGCGAGACGSCTVLLDGRAVNSCDTPMWAVQGHEVTTVEGLGTPERPHPVQQAFIDLQAAQCGYCINGIMMSVAGLRQQDVVPSEAALQAALSRHLCRCGTHWRILQAARRALELGPASS